MKHLAILLTILNFRLHWHQNECRLGVDKKMMMRRSYKYESVLLNKVKVYADSFCALKNMENNCYDFFFFNVFYAMYVLRFLLTEIT